MYIYVLFTLHLASTISVSYTHLDVYKRQVCMKKNILIKNDWFSVEEQLYNRNRANRMCHRRRTVSLSTQQNEFCMDISLFTDIFRSVNSNKKRQVTTDMRNVIDVTYI